MIIRTEVRNALKTAIVTAINDTTVHVAKGFNAPEAAVEQFWLGGTRGAIEYEVFANNATPHDDQFTIDVLVLAAKPGQNQATAEARAQTMMNAVIKAVKPTNGQFLGIDTVTDTGVSTAYVVEVLIADIDGPHTQPRGEGDIAFGSVEVAVHTRSTYL